ncbi:valine--tRNA ligase [Opitutales bacterium ASA1]|uniref:valine--tRNA ligase n=1 Tax=Congregicoccus parvus TaxID=3081749 RepID=UPI002B2F3D2E|nr:valine--tRNA ligase [Opitutales bacterium ASA1]
MATEISNSYDPGAVESKWYSTWVDAACFAGEVDPTRPAYSIVIPPPNVTGVLTMGHVLNNTIQDILVRRARQEGHSALWLPGTDHAGIATQTVVERMLRKEGKHRRDLGREAFLERVKEWRVKHGGIIIKQLERLGASCDWERNTFTMDEHYSRAVLHAFVELFKRGHIYRGKRMVNWCPVSLTALSDEEVIMKPQRGALYRVRYELVDRPGEHIQVATTRPETIPGDVAIAVHPSDERYRDLIGRCVWRPLMRAPIPIIADAAVDPTFGAGALKVTPAHDRTDFEIGQRHKLEIIDVLEPNGVLNAHAGPGLEGLERFAGRKRAAELLRESGALVDEEVYENNVGFSERADVPIEPRLTQQWWLRYPRVEEAKAAVRDGHIRFHPERWSKVYLNWLENIQDWCISRQLWWGHRIPVWYRKGVDRESLTEADLLDATKIHVSLEGPADPENWEQEEDVLDTWASSWLWPFATMGWPDEATAKEQGLDYFYPTTTLVTGPDIIFFWVARMIMAGLEFMRPGAPLEQRIPFKHVYFTGIIRDAQGRKMSKSLGNSPDPLDLIERFGADGLRFGIMSMAPQGQDIRFQEDRIETGRNFCNKLWNACRFRQMSGPMADNASLEAILARIDPAALDVADHAILERLLATEAELATCFREFEFSRAVQTLYAFFWTDFCDWYVEVSKARIQDPAQRDACLAVQDLVIRQTLLALHPFTPFITQELWSLLGYGEAEGARFIQDCAVGCAAAFATRGVAIDATAVAETAHLKSLVGSARALKAEYNLASKRDVKFFVVAANDAWPTLQRNIAMLTKLVGASAFERREAVDGAPAAITPLGTIYLDLSSSLDVAAERERLGKELEKIEKAIAGTQARLANESFVSKAPPAVIEGAKKQLADNEAKRDEMRRLLAALGA